MCNHRFVFPEDRPENLNADGKTLTGRCKCGSVQNAYGMRWMIKREEAFQLTPNHLYFIDKKPVRW
jgi:hypothetical protein